MTKEIIFDMLNNTIDCINDKFCETYCDDILASQLEGNPNFPVDWSIESGISKAVILIKGEPYVIKMPFYRMYDEEGYNDAHYEWGDNFDEFVKETLGEEAAKIADFNTIAELKKAFIEYNPEPMEDDECWYIELEGADNITLSETRPSGWDYCHLECRIYKAAVERGLGAYFAEEGFLGELSCGHPVYYQQRCIPFSSLVHDYSAKTEARRTSARDTCDKLHMHCFNSLWIADFLETYGADELARLHEFLQEMDIGDLRDCNIGYLDNVPILFDYSGFRQWD